MSDTRTAEELAQDYTAMGHSVDLINGIIDGSRMTGEDQSEKNDCVNRNVEHFDTMTIKFNSSERLIAQQATYYRYWQPLKHSRRMPKKTIYAF